MNYEAYEREIDLKDLLFHILYRWRSILVVGCIFCLLLGGYRVMKNVKTPPAESDSEVDYKQALEDYEQALELYNIAVSGYELKQTIYNQALETYEKWLNQQNIYMQKSVLMHTDPYNKPIATANFFIRLDDSEWDRLPNNDNLSLDPTNSVIQAYASNFYSVIDWEPLEKLTGVESLYLRELIGVSSDYNSDTITLTVVYSDGATAQKLLEEITGQMLKRQTVADNVAAHTITVISQSLTYMIDNSLANSQKSNADTINTYEQYIIDNQKNLATLAEPEEPEKPEEPKAPERVPVTSGLIKYLILGAIMGIFLMAGFYGVRYLLSNVVRADRELKERFGFQLLGAFPAPDKKGVLSFIDRLLERMEGTHVKSDNAVVCQCIAANITNLAKDNKNLLLTGTVSAEELDVLAKNVAPDLKDIRLQVMDSMKRNPETIKQLTRCDGVVLVEKRNVSKYNEIQEEQDLIRALEIPVVGYVML